MSKKHNLFSYIDKELVEKSGELGFNLSRTFENHLKQLNSQLTNNQTTQNSVSSQNKSLVVGLPGFEPESIEPKSTSLDQASRQPRGQVREM